MNRVASGIVAGFIATIILSFFMILKSIFGLLPSVNAIKMLTQMGAHYLNLPPTPLVGWIIHFLIGTVLWGFIFQAIADLLPGHYWWKGMIFAVCAWGLMMILVMPVAGAGFFGMKLGIGAPVATFILHIIYGIMLGAIFGKLVPKRVFGSANNP